MSGHRGRCRAGIFPEEQRAKMTGRNSSHRLLLLCAAVLLFGGGCRKNGGGEKIVVGSKNFTEQIVLAELFAQQIEAHSVLRVERRLNLGGTVICHDALVSGKIDLYPEYTGTALTAVLKDPLEKDPSEVFRRVQEEYRAVQRGSHAAAGLQQYIRDGRARRRCGKAASPHDIR